MHVFSPYIQGPIPSGIGPCFFTAGKKDKSKRIIRKTKRKQKTHYYCPGKSFGYHGQSAWKLSATFLRKNAQKSFAEISYISYTRSRNLQCFQGISGEGQGVGFRCMVQEILHPPPLSSASFHVIVAEGGVGFRAKCIGKSKNCRLHLHKSYTLHLNPTPYPSPEISSKYRASHAVVQEMQEIFKNFFC